MGILGMHDEEAIGNERIRASHAGGYGATADIDLAAVADIDEENLTTFGDAWDIASNRQYLGHEAMLAEEDLDVVSVCTPSLLHRDHVVDAARSAASPDVICVRNPSRRLSVTLRRWSHSATKRTPNSSSTTRSALRTSCRRCDPSFRTRIHWGTSTCLHAVPDEISCATRRTYSTRSCTSSTSRAERVSGYISGENEAVDLPDADRAVDDSAGGGFCADGRRYLRDHRLYPFHATTPR